MIRSHTKTIYESLGRDPVHPFPARMAPGIALDILTDAATPSRVLDPMMGSGTVLALARACGHRSVGIDLDPLAVLISRVWTIAVDPDEVRDKAVEIICKARIAFSSLAMADAYPTQADSETRQFVCYWFDGYARRQLASLANSIARVQKESIRDILWCGFSRIIIAKQAGASLAMDLAHSRPHKAYSRSPIKPFNKFLWAVERVLENCVNKNEANRGPAPCIRLGDARRLPIADASIDLVLTSPPYLNAIDYMRCSKFSLIWMGHSISDLRRVRSESVGTEAAGAVATSNATVRDIITDLKVRSSLSNHHIAVLARYIHDMHLAVREVARVLVSGGRAVYVVGENTVRGTFIRNSHIMLGVAETAGLKFRERRVRTLPANRRYLPPPARRETFAALDTRMRREVVLAFTRP